MAKSEPSLAPEWLKGASGVSNNHPQTLAHHDEGGPGLHSASRQRYQVHRGQGFAETYDSSRYTPSSDRSYYSTRRGSPAVTSPSERSSFDTFSNSREPHSRAYPSFGRSQSYASEREKKETRDSRGLGFERGDRTERDYREKERDWDWEREKGATLFASEDRDRSRTDLAGGAYRRPASGPGSRYDEDLGLRRTHSASAAHGSSEEAREVEKKEPRNVLITPTQVSAGSLTSSIQKAAFERNFPSLSNTDQHWSPSLSPPLAITAGGASTMQTSPRTWQSSPRAEVSRGAGTLPTLSISTEGWSSALAEVPLTLASTQSSDGQSTAAGDLSSAAVPASRLASVGFTPGAGGALASGMATASAAALALGGLPGSTGPKMSEALSQTAMSRARVQSQSAAEAQQLEELALKQSRQLVPMRPSLPKTIALSPREKAKAKASVSRGAELTGSVTPKGGGIGQGSHGPSLFRSTSLGRAENVLKPPVGKLLVPRKGKEVTLVPGRAETGLLPLGGSNGGIGTPAASLGGAAAVSLGAVSATGPVRPKIQLLDRHSLPITTGLGMLGQEQAHSGGGPSNATRRETSIALSSAEDKQRHAAAAQNRSDFFKALRKKASNPLPVHKGSDEEEDGQGIAEGRQKMNSREAVEVNGVSPAVNDEVIPQTDEAEKEGASSSCMNGNILSLSVLDRANGHDLGNSKEEMPAYGELGTGFQNRNGILPTEPALGEGFGNASYMQVEQPLPTANGFTRKSKEAAARKESIPNAWESGNVLNGRTDQGDVTIFTEGANCEPAVSLDGGIALPLSEISPCEGADTAECPGTAGERISEGSHRTNAPKEARLTDTVDQSPRLKSKGEEEEAAFLRSLGWTEEDGGEGLTEEEISAFYQQPKAAIAGPKPQQIPSHPARSLYRSAPERPWVGSIGSISSGMSSSDSESDDDLATPNAARRR